MEGSKFAKLCKDCGLIDKKLSSTDVDLIFAKVSRCLGANLVSSRFRSRTRLNSAR